MLNGKLLSNNIPQALSGDILIVCSPSTAGTSAATLNAAAAGAFTKTITISLKTAAAILHNWATLDLIAATSEVCVDADIAAPTVSDASPNLVNGTIDVILTYNTNAGSTKTYASGDTVTLTVSAAAEGILGYVIADATFIDTVIA